MKKLLLLGATLVVAASSALFAQSFNVTAPGYSSAKLFDSTPGFTIGGVGADSSGNVYYIENDPTFGANAILYKRSAGDGFATATQLFDFGSPTFGSFVVVEGSRVYFGESVFNVIRSVNLDGTSPVVHGTVVNNYDLTFHDGGAFLSANPSTDFNFPHNHVYKFDLNTGATDSILDATPDFSGGIAFDSTGALLYGASTSSSGGIYRFLSTDVTNAFGPSELTLTPPDNRIFDNGGNLYLAYDGLNGLWSDSGNTLSRHDLTGLTSETIGTTPDFLGNLSYQDGELFATVTDFGTNQSAVFTIVPEPSGLALLCLGGLTFLGGRRRRA